MEKKIIVDVLAKTKEVESQGVHTATQSLIGLLKNFGKDDYKIISTKKMKGTDIVIATAIYPSFFFGLKKNKTTIAMVHFLPNTLDGSITLPKFVLNIFKKYVLSFYRRAKELVTVNPYFVDELVKLGFDKEHVHAIPNFVSDRVFYPLSVSEKMAARKRFNIPDNAFVVMGCGQTQPRKGIQDFVAVAEDNPDMTFIWVGGFTFGHLTSQYRKMKRIIDNPPPNVRFIGIVPNNEMNYLYNCADVFFMPSYDELFPMTLLEASNVNIPLLVRDLPLYVPILKDKALKGKTNIEFSSILKKIIKDPIFRAEAGIKSSELAEIYTAQNVYKEWDVFLKSLVEKYGGSSK